jgi:hypothetical protein
VGTTTTIAAIRATFCRKLVPHKVFNTCTTMSAAAKYPYVINEVLFHAGGKDSFYGASSSISVWLHGRLPGMDIKPPGLPVQKRQDSTG